jgi:hypothetical protein
VNTTHADRSPPAAGLVKRAERSGAADGGKEGAALADLTRPCCASPTDALFTDHVIRPRLRDHGHEWFRAHHHRVGGASRFEDPFGLDQALFTSAGRSGGGDRGPAP